MSLATELLAPSPGAVEDAEYPASRAQLRLWAAVRGGATPGAYTICFALRLRGRLQRQALEAALAALQARHDALRTGFAETAGGLRQLVHASAPLPLTWSDHADDADPQAACRTALDAWADAPFDFGCAPLWRVRVARLRPDDHVLSVVIHHIVADAWSIDVMQRDLALLYAACAAGRPDRLPPIGSSVRHIVAMEAQQARSAAFAAARDYWRPRLVPPPPALSLSGARRPERLEGRSHVARIDELLVDGLRERAEAHGTSLFVALTALVRLLLCRYTGETDIVLGAPIAGRDDPALEAHAGLFMNMLPLRDAVDPAKGFGQLLLQAHRSALEAYQHRHYPFDRIVEDLGQRGVLFDVIVALQPDATAAPALADLAISTFELRPTFARYDLAFEFADHVGELVLVLTYDTAVFDAAAAARMAGHFQRLVEGVVATPEVAVGALKLLTGAERRALAAWNDTARELPEQSVAALFAAQAQATPEAVALRDAAGELSYAALAAASERLARRLVRRLGTSLAAAEAPVVGLCLGRGRGMVIAMLAVLRAGAAYLPLDPEEPAERLGFMLAEAPTALVLVEGDSGHGLPADCPTLDLAEPEAADADPSPAAAASARHGRPWAGQSRLAHVQDSQSWVAGPGPAMTQNPAVAQGGMTPGDMTPGEPATAPPGITLPETPGGERLAYVMFTSGSTGRPKAVEIPHQAIVRLVCNTDYVRLGAGQVIAQAATPLFDAATFEIWGALLSGATLRLLERDDVLDPDRLAALLRAGEVTTMFLTTSLFNRLVQRDPGLFASLDQLLVGGEAADPAAMRAVRAAGPPRRLLNAYGPTETTTFASWHEVGEVAADATTVPIGRPIANTTLHLLDAAGEAVPDGVAGEIHIGGPGLARGYRNRPDLTAERFVTHSALGRLYRTGDLARRRGDGALEFLGRRDQQIKLRGFRIEPAEIEAQLRQLPGITDALVRRHAVNGQPALVGWVVTAAADDADPAAWRAQLRRVLPDYMVPAVLVTLAGFPLTANGKIDTARLPEPLAVTDEAAPPTALSQTEELLAGLWAEVLPTAGNLHSDTNFFDAGGHSLMAMQLVARVRERLGVELALRTLFEHATLGELALQIEGALRGSTLPELRRLPADATPPLSFAQQRLWFLARLDAAASAAYTISAAFELAGQLDGAALRRALVQLTSRQQSLRMNVAAVDGEPVLRLRAPYDPLRVHETLFDAAALGAALGAPFDLEHDALLRLDLWPIEAERFVLGFAIHHIIADGWSLDVLVRELAVLYAAESTGTAANLAPLAVQYGDYAAWQRDWLTGAERARQLAHWREALEGMPALLELPGDFARPAVRRYRGGQHHQPLDAALVEQVTALGRQHGATLFMTLLAAFDVLLARWSGSDDIAVGSPVANRTHSQSEGLIGFFVNTLVLRVRLDLAQPFTALLETVRRVALSAYAHQDLPFEVLVSELQPQRSLSHSPLFQVMFALQNAPLGAVSLPGLALRPWPQPLVTAKFDLVVSLGETAGGGLTAVWEYSSDLFAPATVARMAGHYATLLEAIVATPDAAVGALKLLTGAERRALAAWNDTARELPEQSVAALFAAQAEAAPAAVALRDAAGELSYAALAAAADQLARRLVRRLGTSLDAAEAPVVGLCLGRGRGMVIAMLAVLRAGAAYLPLDPEEPEERLGFMLAEAATALVLVDGDSGHRLPADCPTLDLASDGGADMGADADLGVEAFADIALPDVPGGERLAYVMFTSGSTGRPKAVEIPHRAIVRLVCNTDYVRLGAGQVIAQAATPLFDAATFEIWGALLSGATLRLLERDDVLDPDRLAALLRAGEVTTLFLTTALFNRLVQLDPKLFAGVDQLLFGGEAVDPAAVRAVRAAAPPRRLMHVYGPTETTTFASWHEVGEVAADATTVPIGRPIANTTLHLLDAAGEAVPDGVAGEIHIGGPGLARGYRNRPDLTAERFVTHSALGRLYRTGDLARRRGDGALEFLGRRDQQIKLRGFRIEPAEIEAQLRHLPGITDALVRRHAVNGQPGLVGWVVTAADDADPAAWRAQLRRVLPDYMVPAVLVTLAGFPLTANGKIDTARLPEPRAAMPTSEAPLTSQEAALAAIWGSVLQRDGIGRHDNFFELGGDSIASIQVVAQARAAGLHFTVADLFRHQTVAQLAPQMTASAPQPAEIARPGVPFPLSPIQNWFFAQPLEEHWHFNQAVLLEPRRQLDPAHLQRALALLMDQHAALRLRFALDADGLRAQHYAANADDAPFHVEDLRALPADRQGAALQERATFWQRSLDLANGPILRLVLFELSRGQRLLWCIHHLAIDAVSWRILLGDLEFLLGSAADGDERALPPASAPFSVWVRHLERHGASDACAASTWSTVPTFDLKLDRDGDPTRSSTRHVERRLDRTVTRALIEGEPHLAYNTRIDDLLLTALAMTLAAWTGSRACVIDIEGHGRGDGAGMPDLSRTVGWFTTVHPVHLVLPDGDAPGALIMAVKEAMRAARRAGLGYGVLRYAAPSPLFGRPDAPIAFNYLGQIDQTIGGELLRFAAEDAGESHTGRGRRARLLDVDAVVSGGVFRVAWSYSANQFDATTIERLADGFVTALEAIVTHCRVPEAAGYTPGDFPLIALPQPELDGLARRYGRAVQAVYPLTPMQGGLLFHSLEDRAAYVELLHCRIDGAFDTMRFRAAWEALVQRHDVLRTVFDAGTQPPAQIVLRSATLPWTEHDWRARDPETQDRELQRLVARERQRGFDLAAAPLLRCHIVRLGEAGVRFVWTFHHLLLDGWSLPILIGELLQLYRDPAASLPARPPFQDYAAWLGRQDQAAALAHWRRVLAGFETPTPLPGARAVTAPHPAETHAECALALDAAESARVLDFARTHRLTVATVLQGAWALLLQRWSGEPDVVFGVTVSGRDIDLPGVQAMFGLLINTIPARVGAESGALVPWLLRLQAAHQDNAPFAFVPLADVQRAADIAAGTPLFDTLLVVENYPMEAGFGQGRDAGLAIADVRFHDHTSYKLTVIASASEEIRLRIGYDQRHFESGVVERLGRQLRTLLLGFVAADAETAIATLKLLDDAECRKLAAWGEAGAQAQGRKTLVGAFAAAVRAHPDRCAMTCDGQKLTYRALAARAQAVAERLQGIGIGRNQLVGLLVARSLDLVVGLVGILTAGAGYLPLDPSTPKSRLEFMLSDAGAVALVADPSLAEGLELGLVPVLAPGTDEGGDRGYAPAAVEPADLAYVIYTSGSTGQPKGVMVTHENVVRLFRTTAPDCGFSAADVWTLFHSTAFDFSVWEIWGALLHGGRLVIASEYDRRDPAALLDLLVRESVTVLNQTPSAFRQFMAEALRDVRKLALRLVIFGGEALELVALAPWFARFGDTTPRLVNMYGITETTVHVTWCPISADDINTSARWIGRKLADLALFLLDAAGRPVPIGAPGEIYVGGAGVARGYLNRPELNAERFVTQEVFGQLRRLYRSGDLGRFREDGTLDYLGRIDQQVKIRGFRIELGEIEATIVGHSAVRQAVVIPRGRDAQRRLIAYVVGDQATVADLPAWLAGRLPDYMVPSHFVPMETLPLTANGKLDRRALPDPTEADLPMQAAAVAARDETEQVIAAIWQEVLGVANVGITHNFFALGGHSLTAVQVVSRLHQARGVRLPVRSVFDHPTVEALASVVHAAAATTRTAIMPAAAAPDYPMSHAQQRLWLDHQATSARNYNMPEAFRFEVALDTAVLRRVFAALIERHEALRTGFRLIDGELRQQILQDLAFNLEQVDVSAALEEEKVTQEIIDRTANVVFEFDAPPLFRVTAIRQSAGRQVIIVVMHHIIGDGWSRNVLHREISVLYDAFSRGQPNPLPALRLQYKDYATWEAGLDFADEERYWSQRLAGAPTRVALLRDHRVPPSGRLRGDRTALVLDPATTQGLRDLAQRRDTSLSNVVLALLKLMLFRVTAQDDICVSMVVANRSDSDLENMLGCFVNLLPIRTRLAADMDFDQLVDQVAESTYEALERQSYPFNVLVSRLNRAGGAIARPFLDVIYAFQSGAHVNVDIGVAAPQQTLRPVESVDFDFAFAKAELCLNVADHGAEGLGLTLEYDSDLFEFPTIGRYLDTLARFASAVAG